jgi:hypothetical protein
MDDLRLSDSLASCSGIDSVRELLALYHLVEGPLAHCAEQRPKELEPGVKRGAIV